MNPQIEQSMRALQPKLDQLCRDNAVQRMALFGSALRPDYLNESDLDILIEFETGSSLGLAFFGLQRDLSELFGRQVDLNTPTMLSKTFRSTVIELSETIYVH